MEELKEVYGYLQQLDVPLVDMNIIAFGAGVALRRGMFVGEVLSPFLRKRIPELINFTKVVKPASILLASLLSSEFAADVAPAFESVESSGLLAVTGAYLVNNSLDFANGVLGFQVADLRLRAVVGVFNFFRKLK